MKTEGGNEILGYFGRFRLIPIPPERVPATMVKIIAV
jgi:hypothetical protein